MIHCRLADRQLLGCRKKNIHLAHLQKSAAGSFFGPPCFSLSGSARCVGGGPVEKRNTADEFYILVRFSKFGGGCAFLNGVDIYIYIHNIHIYI